MARQNINVGATPNDKTGDSLRVSFTKTNSNFTELYANVATLTSNVANLSIDVSTPVDYGDITNAPSDILDLTDNTNALNALPYMLTEFPQVVNPAETSGLIADNTLGDVPSINSDTLGYIATAILNETWVASRGYVKFADNTTYKISGVDSTLHGSNGGSITFFETISKSGTEVWPLEIISYEETISPYINLTANTSSWSFYGDGDLVFPSGGKVSRVGEGWTGLKSEVDHPISLMYVGQGDTIVTEFTLSDTSAILTTNRAGNVQHDWEFNKDGTLSLPGGTILDPTGNIFEVREAGDINFRAVNSINIFTGDGAHSLEVETNGMLRFDEVSDFKVIPTPLTSIGVTGNIQGMMSFTNEYIYYCTATYDGVNNIWKRIQWSTDTW